MSTTQPDDNDPLEGERIEDPLDRVREHRESFEYLAETDLPIAPYAQNALDRLEEAEDKR